MTGVPGPHRRASDDFLPIGHGASPPNPVRPPLAALLSVVTLLLLICSPAIVYYVYRTAI